MANPFDSATLTPLLIISGYAEVLRKDIESNHVVLEDILKGLNHIEESAKKIKELLDEMADSLRSI